MIIGNYKSPQLLGYVKRKIYLQGPQPHTIASIHTDK